MATHLQSSVLTLIWGGDWKSNFLWRPILLYTVYIFSLCGNRGMLYNILVYDLMVWDLLRRTHSNALCLHIAGVSADFAGLTSSPLQCQRNVLSFPVAETSTKPPTKTTQIEYSLEYSLDQLCLLTLLSANYISDNTSHKHMCWV